MAFENLFIRSKKFIGNVQLDAVILESHSNRVTVTDYPVESGLSISDNAVVEPKEVTINGVVTNTPLGSQFFGQTSFGQVISSVSGLFGSSTESNLTRSQAAYRSLILLMESRELISIQTKLTTYNNMLITSIDTDQDTYTAEAPVLSITCRELILTETQVVKLTAEELESGKIRNQGTSSARRGAQEPKQVPESENTSVLQTLINWF